MQTKESSSFRRSFSLIINESFIPLSNLYGSRHGFPRLYKLFTGGKLRLHCGRLTFWLRSIRYRHGIRGIFAVSGPDLNPIGPCSVKMWGPRPRINFLTLMYKTFGRYMWTVRNIAAVIWIEIGNTAFCIRKLASDNLWPVGAPFLWGPLFGRTCWACLSLPLLIRHV